MKKISNILLFTFLLCLGGLQIACTDNMEDRNVDGSGKVMVRVQVSARDGGTSTPDPEQINANESKIRSVRLYAFDGDILDNMVYEEKVFAGSATVDIEVSTGNKTFYAVINEPDDVQIHSALALANRPNGIKQVQYQITNYLNSNRGILVNALNKTGDYVLPMYGIHSTPVSETTPGTGISMSVDRAVARIDVYMAKAAGVTSTATTGDATLEVKYPSQTGYIATDNVASTKRDSTYTLDGSVSLALTNASEKIYSFYVPEQNCPNTANRLRFTVGGIKWDGLNTNYDPFILGDDASNPDGILTKIERNKVYQIYCNMHPKTKDINVNVKILAWNAVAPQDSTLHPGKLGMTNCYIVTPGRSVSIPVTNVYKIWNWEFGQMLEPKKEVKAEIIWEDTQDLITGVTVLKNDVDNSYSKIQVNTAPGKSGNAVIGMWIDGDADKTYRWSWHIWVTDYDPQKLNFTSKGVTIMDRYLGALTNNYDAEGTVQGLNYQWGRKDPFPRKNQWSGGDALFGTHIELKQVTVDDNLLNSIYKPFVFYYNSERTLGDWYTTDIAKQNGLLWQRNIKTIYDPCPAGWRVPAIDSDVWSNLTLDSPEWSGGDDAGIHSSILGFYPYATVRAYNTGVASQSMYNAGFWFSNSEVNNAFTSYLPYSAALSPSINSTARRASGYSVRCVKE